MVNEIVVHRAEKIHADAVARMEIEVFPENCFNETTVADLFLDGSSWVALNGQEVIGYLIGCRFCDRIDIIRVGVTQEYRRKGVGKLLLDHILTDSKKLLLMVRDTNISAIELYKKYGFVVVAELIVDDKHIWVMQTRDR